MVCTYKFVYNYQANAEYVYYFTLHYLLTLQPDYFLYFYIDNQCIYYIFNKHKLNSNLPHYNV